MNGELGFFSSERGIRQGDPFSRFLFILTEEGLESLMMITIHVRGIKDFKISGNSGEVKEICHLLHTDCTVLFSEPQEKQIRFIKTILQLFEATWACLWVMNIRT